MQREYRVKEISYPFRLDQGEFPKRDIDVEAVRSVLMTLFRTSLRGRVMRPRTGNNLSELVFENKGPLFETKAKRSITQMIRLNEPRAKIEEIKVYQNSSTEGVQESEVLVHLYYSVKGVFDKLILVVS